MPISVILRKKDMNGYGEITAGHGRVILNLPEELEVKPASKAEKQFSSLCG